MPFRWPAIYDLGIQAPSIILVMTDQQRWDWVGGPAGSPFETPNLDRLAAAGVTFERAYSGGTTCVPARTALLTGLPAHRAPTIGTWGALRSGAWTVARALRDAGWHTALIGRMHLHPMYAAHGFDTVRLCENVGPHSGYAPGDVDDYGRWIVEATGHDPRIQRLDDGDDQPRGITPSSIFAFPHDPALHSTAWIEREARRVLAERRPEQPLFLVVSFPRPHGPFDPPEPWASAVDPADVEPPPPDGHAWALLPDVWHREVATAEARRAATTERRVRRTLAAIAGLVRQIDDSLGRLLDEIDLARSIVCFTSDHGDFGGHRGLLGKVPWMPFDDLLRVPLVIGGAGAAAGTRTDVLAQTQDLAASFLDWAGLDPPDATVPWCSLRPLVEGCATPDLRDRLIVASCAEGYPTIVRGRSKLLTRGPLHPLLFDLAEDPAEHHDRSRDPGRRDELRELSLALHQTSVQRTPAAWAPPAP